MQVAEKELQPGKRIPITDIGAGCYPTTIFFNHSCSPNTVRINQGKRVSDDIYIVICIVTGVYLRTYVLLVKFVYSKKATKITRSSPSIRHLLHNTMEAVSTGQHEITQNR